MRLRYVIWIEGINKRISGLKDLLSLDNFPSTLKFNSMSEYYDVTRYLYSHVGKDNFYNSVRRQNSSLNVNEAYYYGPKLLDLDNLEIPNKTVDLELICTCDTESTRFDMLLYLLSLPDYCLYNLDLREEIRLYRKEIFNG